MRNVKNASAIGAVVVALALGLAACGSSSSSSSTTEATEGVSVTDVWSRATAEGATTGVVYLTLESPVDDALVSASVPEPVATMAQLHETTSDDSAMSGSDDMSTEMDSEMSEDTSDTMAGGMMGMREVTSIPIPAGDSVTLEPGGYHIMLMGLAGPLEDGQTFDVTLTFETAPAQTVTATVRS